MARVDQLGRSLGCRLTMLVFWMGLVCCAFYASRLSRSSDVSIGHFKDSSRQRRYTASDPQPQCQMQTPSANDLARLRRNSINKQSRSLKGLVHCSVVNACDGNEDNWQASCFSRDCTGFKVHVLGKEKTSKSSVDARGLSGVVERLFMQNGRMEEDDVSRYVKVWCETSDLGEMRLVTDDIPSRGCPPVFKQTKDKDRKIHQSKPTKHIHLFYFRFLSHWEVSLRFPALTSLFDEIPKQGGVELKFDKHQATGWHDDEVLAMLLQGRSGRFRFKDSLLRDLQNSGYCLRLEDLSCGGSRKQEQFVSNVTSYGRVKCASRGLRHQDTIMERLCTSGNLTDARARSVLTSLLANVHASDGTGRDARHTMSVSLLNTKDFKNSDVLDLALKNIVFNLLNEKNNIIIFMSGVGNPAFIRFDQSTSLQTQASNPVLQILSPGTLTNATLLDASVLNQSLFSMHNVHDFVKSLVQNEAGVIPSEGDFGSGINEDYLDGEISKSVCNALGVQPPFLCLCQDENVRYENDTLTVGFADFLVGLVNTQLRHSNLAVGGGSAVSAHSTCAKLYGASFTNVRVGHHKEKKRIFMDLALMAEGFEDRLYRHAVLEMRDMDKLPRSEVHFLRGGHSMNPQGGVTRTALNFNESDILLKTLCNTERNLNSRATSDGALLKELSQRKHFGRKPTVIHVHDNCLYMFVRDFGDSVSVDAGNMCRDRHYDVMLHLSLMNMMALTPLPISAGLGHAQTEFLTVLVKVSYTVPTFAYKLHPDFTVTYDL